MLSKSGTVPPPSIMKKKMVPSTTSTFKSTSLVKSSSTSSSSLPPVSSSSSFISRNTVVTSSSSAAASKSRRPTSSSVSSSTSSLINYQSKSRLLKNNAGNSGSSSGSSSSSLKNSTRSLSTVKSHISSRTPPTPPHPTSVIPHFSIQSLEDQDNDNDLVEEEENEDEEEDTIMTIATIHNDLRSSPTTDTSPKHHQHHQNLLLFSRNSPEVTLPMLYIKNLIISQETGGYMMDSNDSGSEVYRKNSVAIMTHVRLGNCGLTGLGSDFKTWTPSMTHLFLQHNLLTSTIELSTLTCGLRFLILSSNKLTSIRGLSRMENCELLDISKNEIDDITMDEYPPNLVYLMVSGNPFVNLFPDHRLRIISRYISSDEGGGRECSLEELDEEPVTVMEIDMASRLYNGNLQDQIDCETNKTDSRMDNHVDDADGKDNKLLVLKRTTTTTMTITRSETTTLLTLDSGIASSANNNTMTSSLMTMTTAAASTTTNTTTNATSKLSMEGRRAMPTEAKRIVKRSLAANDEALHRLNRATLDIKSAFKRDNQ